MEILTEEKIQYQKEQDALLKTILDLRFFNPWRHLTKFNDDRSLLPDSKLELFITSTCDQNCEYCYLQQYPKLYPAQYNKPELILQNMRILFNYIIANQFELPCLDVFSGEVFATPFGWDVLDLIYEYVIKGMKVKYVLTTSNCSFINDPIAFQKIQQFVNKFNNIGCPLVFSISIDGKIVDNNGRPRRNGELYSDEFYDNVFAFAKVNNFLFHPMVSAQNIKQWPENYKWWKEQDKKYNLPIGNIMTLEVRNEGWTEENMKDYCTFLKILMDEFFYGECHGDPKLFGNALVSARQLDNDPSLNGYVPWAIGECDSFQGCTVPNHLTVRLGDLAICPCHRQAYDEYLYGHFVVENNRITGIKANNPQMAIKIYMGNILTSMPLCDQCEFNFCCLRGCFGSQLESQKDPFFPIKNICDFFKTKYTYIMNYYREHGVIDYLKTFSLGEPRSASVAKLLQLNDILEAKNNGLGTT